jgi:hypothetical protein
MQILFGDIVSALQEGSGLGGEDEADGGPGAGAVLDALPLTRGQHEIHGRRLQIIGDGYITAELLQRYHLFLADHWLHSRLATNGVSLQDLQLLFLGGIFHENLEQESIQLGLGQREGAFHLDWVLRGQDEEAWPPKERSASWEKPG